MKILVINPGSTTTKLAVYEDQQEIFQYKVDHAQDQDFQSKFKHLECWSGNHYGRNV